MTIGPDTMAMIPGDKFLYGNSYDTQYEGFAIATDGSVTSLGTPTMPSGTAISVRPGHPELYLPASDGTITVLAVDPNTGAAGPITGSPFGLGTAAGVIPDTPVFTPDGNRMYIGPFESGAIVGASLDAAGAPTPMTGSPWDFSPALTSISCVSMSADGKYLLAADDPGKVIGVFTFDAGGTPTQVTGSPFVHTTPSSSVSGMAITF